MDLEASVEDRRAAVARAGAGEILAGEDENWTILCSMNWSGSSRLRRARI